MHAGEEKLGRSGRWIVCVVIGGCVLAVAGCSNLASDNCSVGKQLAASGGGIACLSARNMRATLFSGDDYPRLWSGDPARTKPNVDASGLDVAPGAPTEGPATVAYVGPMRVDYPVVPQSIAADVAEAHAAGAANFDPDARIAVNFNQATIKFFLRQMLGGALGVNYIAGSRLKGSVTFRTVKPLPKGQVLEVVRDILARNGLSMVLMNGVYEIGKASALSAIAAAAKRGDSQGMKIVNVTRGSALQVASIVRQLVPGDVRLTPMSSDDRIIVHASAGDLNMATELVQEISTQGVGENKMAIIPVHEAPPGKIAAELSAFYRDRLGKGADLTIIPLESQEAILVGTHDVRLMAGLRNLVLHLDRDTSAARGLRIIQLTYLSAKDIVPQLSSLFGRGGGGSRQPPPQSSGSSGARSQSSGGASPYGSLGASAASGPGAGGGSSDVVLPQVRPGTDGAPGFSTIGEQLPSEGSPGSDGGGDQGGSGAGGGAGSPYVSGGGGGVKFVADTRNNAVMIYSSYDIFKRVRSVLRVLDVPQAQVVIEGTIAEVTLNDNLEYGVQWYLQSHGFNLSNGASAPPGTGSTTPTPASAPGGAGGAMTIGGMLGGINANVVLNALQSITKVKVISSPYLTVVNGKEARLVIGDQIPYAQKTQSSSSNGTVTITNAIQTMDTGIILDVTPKIRSNNSVDLTIDQEVKQPDNSILQGNTQPVISTRSIKSNVIVQSGRTILLGGMIQEGVNKLQSGVPAAQNLPLIGGLFKTKNDTSTRTELLVMITPRVVRRSSQLENITRLLRDQIHVQ